MVLGEREFGVSFYCEFVIPPEKDRERNRVREKWQERDANKLEEAVCFSVEEEGFLMLNFFFFFF
jgi:hypothetical protein